MRIVFFGTPDFAVASLRRLVADGHEILAAVTPPDKPAGRGHRLLAPAVKEAALEMGIPVLQPPLLRDPDFLAALEGLSADLFVVIAFRMLPEAVWAMPPLGTFNLHASLLPAYRGAAPINHAIINGETLTGVTTFMLNHDIDTGDILLQASCPIHPDDDAGTLHDRLMQLGADITSQTVRAIADGTAVRRPQNPDISPTPAPKLFKDNTRIDWQRTATEIHNMIRGLSPYPAAWTTLPLDGHDTTVKIFRSAILDDRSLAPGQIAVDNNSLLAGTGQGTLRILELQVPGRRRMNADEYLRGSHLPGDARFI